ncbi:MAG: hypothetical protein LBK18_05045 [Prevotellaceae bacterium]|jgi:CRISPR/Cas system CSM-associated protein Csm2 small subunit|nr:hypothetical protein [Prevotellaceae bacterium]
MKLFFNELSCDPVADSKYSAIERMNVFAKCERLKHNPYVEEMRSTDWGGNRFIRKIHGNNIEIVLHKTQRKYALLVKTTGRNLRETQGIAKILEEKFNK